MTNFFDRFDTPTQPANFFDRFDTSDVQAVARGQVQADTKSDPGQDFTGESIDPQSMTKSFLLRIASGGTLGFDDEILSTVHAFLNDDGRSFDERRKEAQRGFRNQKEQALRDNPASAIAGDVTGSLALAGLPLASGTSLVTRAATPAGRIGAGIVEGTGIGTIAGFGNADEEDVFTAKRLDEAGIGALIGAGTGLGVGVGMEAIASTVRGLARTLRTSPKKAHAKVMEALEADGLTPDRANRLLQEARQISSQATLADIAGENTRNLLRSATNVSSNKALRPLNAKLDQRQRGQFFRLKNVIQKALGNTDDFFATADTLKKVRKNRARPVFEAAYAKPVPFTRELEEVLKRPVIRAAIPRARTAAQNEGKDFEQLFAREIGQDADGTPIFEITQVPGLRDLHRIKVELDNIIGGLKRGTETSLKNMNARSVLKAKQDLLSAINRPDYKAALKQYAGDSATINAFEEGANFLKMQPEEIRELLRGYGATEQDMFRLASGRALVDRIGTAGATRDRVKAVFDSPGLMQRLRAIYPNLKDFRELEKALAFENKFTGTRRAVQGNSTTARQIADLQSGADEPLSNLGEAAATAAQAATGDTFGLFKGLARQAGARIAGIGPKTAAQIIELLVGKNTNAQTIAQALEQRGVQISQQKLAQMTVQEVLTLAFGGAAVPALASGT